MSKTRKKIEALLKRVSKLNDKIKKLRTSSAKRNKSKKKKKAGKNSSTSKKAPSRKKTVSSKKRVAKSSAPANGAQSGQISASPSADASRTA